MNNDIKIFEVLDYLPKHIRQMVKRLPDTTLSGIEEIRLRLGKPLSLAGCSLEMFLDVDGKV
jgi:stage III sporulation protein SpoIIIAA